MTMEREFRNGPFVISCDNCQESYECEGYDFHDALADAKEGDWRARRFDTEWKHFCSLQCEKDFKQ